MADNSNGTEPIPQPIYPAPTLPTFFADGVVNFSNSAEVSKFYFFRFDPSMNAVGPNQLQPAVQAVMPLSGFLQTAAFFNAAVANLIATGAIKQEAWDSAKEGQRESKFNG